ncbi:hypothetical protein BKD03_02610 [Brucella sp. 09RB8471]|nr:hypothetical protein BKD03_02610 [Brucella sp. 09RB8471]
MDRLTFTNVDAATKGADLVNWEVLTLDNTKLAITDEKLKVGEASEAGSGVKVTNGSVLDGGVRLALDGVNVDIDGTSTTKAGDVLTPGTGLLLTGGSNINNQGTLTSRIDMGAGNNTVNLLNGQASGDITTHDGDNTVNWIDGRWDGNFLGGNSNDTVNVSSPYYDGTVKVLDGGDDTSTPDGAIDRLTFSGVTAKANGANIQNWELVNLRNSNLTLLDSTLKTGKEPGTGLNLEGSQLHTNNNFLLDGNVSLDPSSVWALNGPTPGASTVTGSVSNAGTITTVNGLVGDTITVAGDYVSNGGKLLFDVNTTTGKNDRLQVGGNASGNGLIVVNDVGGNNPDIAPSFKVVEVAGKNDLKLDLIRWDYVTPDGTKSLSLGAYGYSLGLGPDGNWYFGSVNTRHGRNYQPGVPVYESYAQVLLGLNGLPTLQQRVGNRYWYNDGNLMISEGADAIGTYAPPEEAGSFIQGNGVWGRVEGIRSRMNPESSTSSASYDIDMFKMQAGLDGQFHDSDAGKLIGGVTVHYGRSSADISSIYGNGDINTDGYPFIAPYWGLKKIKGILKPSAEGDGGHEHGGAPLG